MTNDNGNHILRMSATGDGKTPQVISFYFGDAPTTFQIWPDCPVNNYLPVFDPTKDITLEFRAKYHAPTGPDAWCDEIIGLDGANAAGTIQIYGIELFLDIKVVLQHILPILIMVQVWDSKII